MAGRYASSVIEFNPFIRQTWQQPHHPCGLESSESIESANFIASLDMLNSPTCSVSQ
jgi:hypothetical protein